MGLDTVVLSATGTFSALLFEKLKLICTFFGDNFGDNMSKSVFFEFVVDCVDAGVGTFIVADADVFVMPCGADGDGIVNVAVFVSAFDAADEGAVIVYEATTVSVGELNGMETVLDTLGAFTDDAEVPLSSADDFNVGTRSLVIVVVVVVVVTEAADDVVLAAEFSF